MTKNVARAPPSPRHASTRGVQTGSGPSSNVSAHASPHSPSRADVRLIGVSALTFVPYPDRPDGERGAHAASFADSHVLGTGDTVPRETKDDARQPGAAKFDYGARAPRSCAASACSHPAVATAPATVAARPAR